MSQPVLQTYNGFEKRGDCAPRNPPAFFLFHAWLAFEHRAMKKNCVNHIHITLNYRSFQNP